MRLRHVSYKAIEFYVPDEQTTDSVEASDVGMQHWFNSSLRSTLTYAEQVWHVNSFVQDNLLNVLEVFCGFGMSTASIDSSRIEKHVAFDIDEGCCEAFQFLRPEADVIIADTYFATVIATKIHKFDYILIEHNAMTVYKAIRDEVERGFLDAIFNSEPRYVAFVDSAKVKEHLHYKTYSAFFEMSIENSTGYVREVDRLFRRTYGYHIKACAHDGINYTYLFEKSSQQADTYDILDTRTVVDLKYFKDLGYIDVEV